ncbi:hypothetical protein M1567_01615 [Candidatus Marsarchaeota archaeon]|jgi:hypothetical protein|nr:hypothetical protein [Candidatus Marsarchaeota archaeon]
MSITTEPKKEEEKKVFDRALGLYMLRGKSEDKHQESSEKCGAGSPEVDGAYEISYSENRDYPSDGF